MNFLPIIQSTKETFISSCCNYSEEEVEEYYLSRDEEGSDYDTSPLKQLNVTINKSQKEFLLGLTGKIPNIEVKRGYLDEVMGPSLEEEDRSLKINFESISITKLFQKHLIPNPFEQITTKDIQDDINELKIQA